MRSDIMNRSEMFKEINRIKTILNEKKNKKDSEIFASLKKFVALAGKLKEVMVDYEHLHFQEVFSKRLKLTESEISDIEKNKQSYLESLKNYLEKLKEETEVICDCLMSHTAFSAEEVKTINGDISDAIQFINETEKRIEKNDLFSDSEILEKFENLEIQLNALDNNISHYNERYPESEKLYSLEEALSFSEKLSAKCSERMNNFLKSKKNEQR